MHAESPARYELRFAGLHHPEHGYAFPCDAEGHVDIDGLPSRARVNYLYAHAVIGRELFAPVIRSVSVDGAA